DDGITWTNVPANGTGQNYTPATELAHGIKYRRKVTDGQGTFGYSNTVQVFVVTPTTMPNVDAGSNKGKDFWVTFGQIVGYYSSDPSLFMQLKIVADTTTQITLDFTNDASANDVITIPGGVVHTYSFSDAQKAAVYNDAVVTSVSDLSVHITSDNPIILYSSYLYPACTDATEVYPTGSLGKEYYHPGYQPLSSFYDIGLMIATQNNTHIYQNTLGGTLLATLSIGQVFNYCGSIGQDITGTHFVSDKPLAYFATTGPNIPYGYGAVDITYEQLFSVDRWGKNFYVPQTIQGVSRIRVIASMNGTVVDGSNFTIPTTTGSQNSPNLNAGQWVELECSIADGCYVFANHPIMVCAYLVGDSYTAVSNDGDPALSWIAPIEQKTHNVMVSRFSASSSLINQHFAMLITETSAKNQTTVSIGGATPVAVSGVTWYDNAASGLSYCSYTLPDDNYYIFDNPNGMVVGGYGLGSYESYYYLAGSASRILSASLKINGDYSDEMIGETYGECNAITFECDASETPASVIWRINGVTQPAYNNLTSWSAALPVDDYVLEMEAVIGDNTFTQITWFRVRCCVTP
ncbi:MAG: IgGFc-binding protein, partial [Bacteroidales bacterium]|nr:IgGFc-binding protein [Bacteroidales bacterium]